MTEVRDKDNYEQWVIFFLRAFHESAEDAIAEIDKLMTLHSRNTGKIEKLGRSAKTTMRLFAYLEYNPMVDIRKTATALEMAFNTVSSAVERLVQAGILNKSREVGRNRIFVYVEYLDILRGGTE